MGRLKLSRKIMMPVRTGTYLDVEAELKAPMIMTQAVKEEIYYYAKNGVPFNSMCAMLSVSPSWGVGRIKKNTEVYVLYKIGVYKANAQVSDWLYENCEPKYTRRRVRDEKGKYVKDKDGNNVFETVKTTNGNVNAQIFWLKSRAGWKDSFGIPEDADSGMDVDNDIINKLTDNEKQALAEIFSKLEGNS